MVNNCPLGCVTDLLASCVEARVAGAPVCRREMLAPVSMRAVEFRSGGLAQPEVNCRELIK